MPSAADEAEDLLESSTHLTLHSHPCHLSPQAVPPMT